jgi:hypothetical protein
MLYASAVAKFDGSLRRAPHQPSPTHLHQVNSIQLIGFHQVHHRVLAKPTATTLMLHQFGMFGLFGSFGTSLMPSAIHLLPQINIVQHFSI